MMKKVLFAAVFCMVCSVVSGPSYGDQSGAFVLRQYPIRNAFEVPPGTTIGITANRPYDTRMLSENTAVIVRGSRSGSHVVTLHLSDDRQTLILHPATPFEYNETVSVVLRAAVSGGSIVSDSFQFRTMVRAISEPQLLRKMEDLDLLAQSQDSIADTLPPMKVLVDKRPTVGTIYISNFGLPGSENENFLLNLDTHGSILRQRNKGHRPELDFKIQPNKLITYFDDENWKYFGLDSAWNVIDTFNSVNYYRADAHELRVFPDGGYALMGVSVTTIDSSQYVPGMVQGATVGGNVIQIFDAHGNLTFEWRGIDHYRVGDAVHVRLTDTLIDFEHANSLDFDSDGNIIISNRHLAEITKISRATGEILWRLGGAHNQFQLINDSVWFSYQHAARLLPNGHLTLFDNGNYDSVAGRSGFLGHSRAVEYALDTTAKTATMVWQYHHSPETFSVAMGYVQRLANGHTIIGWGLNYDYAMTELDRRDSTVFELTLGPNNVSYRALIDPNPDSLFTDEGVAEPQQPAALPASIGLDHSRVLLHVTVEKPEMVTVAVFDPMGREVLPMYSAFESEGAHAIELQTQSLSAGSYLCTIRTAGGQTTVCPFAIAK